MISIVEERTLATSLKPLCAETQRSRKEQRPDRVLIAEHRDEVFARLAADLRASGYTVFRATCVDDVARMYSYGQIELVLFSVDLPCNDVRVAARRFHVFDAYARIWLYGSNLRTFDPDHADLSRIEKTLDHDGGLLRLADQIREQLNELTPSWSALDMRPLRMNHARNECLTGPRNDVLVEDSERT